MIVFLQPAVDFIMMEMDFLYQAYAASTQTHMGLIDGNRHAVVELFEIVEKVEYLSAPW